METYLYDEGGRLNLITKADGTKLSMSFDAFSRLQSIHDATGASAVEVVRRFYDHTLELGAYLAAAQVENAAAIAGELKRSKGRLVGEVAISRNNAYLAGPAYVADLYSYASDGRVEAKYKYVPRLGWQKIELLYDYLGNVKTKTVRPKYLATPALPPIITHFEYNDLNQLSKVRDGSLSEVISYSYTETGLAQGKTYRGGGATSLSCDYVHNIRDWTRKIHYRNEVLGQTEFSEDLSYEGLFNGSISGATYSYRPGGAESKVVAMNYGYDGVDRLVRASETTTESAYDEAFSYDNIGRIRQMRRGGDDLTGYAQNIYHYGPGANRLAHVSGKHANTDNFDYDARGNMTEDKSKALKMDYDWRDRPERFTLHEGQSDEAFLEMVYDAAGNRVLKFEESNGVVRATGYVEDELVYESESFDSLAFQVAFSYLPNNEGRIKFGDGTKDFYLKDHLGSTRSVLAQNGTREKSDAYLAYGSRNALVVPVKNNFKKEFTGKEFDDLTGLYYFGKRYYDPDLGLWISPDPARQFHSPYSYAGNGFNPVNGSDGDGNVFNPVGASVGAVIGVRNMYVAQMAYYENGGESYWAAVGVGLTAYGTSVLAGAYSLGGEGALAATAGGMVVGASTGVFSSALGQKIGDSNKPIDWDIAATEGVKGGVAGAAGGAAGGIGAKLLVETMKGKIASEVIGQGAGQVATEVLMKKDLTTPDKK